MDVLRFSQHDARHGALVVSATFTAEPLLAALRFWLNELGIGSDVEIGPYGQVLQGLLDPTSALSSNTRGMNVVMLRTRDWLRELPRSEAGSMDFLRAYVEERGRELERAIRARHGRGARTLLLLCPSGGAAEP